MSSRTNSKNKKVKTLRNLEISVEYSRYKTRVRRLATAPMINSFITRPSAENECVPLGNIFPFPE